MTSSDPSALEYHEATKHSELSVRMSAHYLDWDNRPYPFKVYRDLSSTALPRVFPHPEREPLHAIGSSLPTTTAGTNLATLAEILFFSGGITRTVKSRAGVYHMRAAPATGALYPIELYLVARDVPGLGAGVYHFNPLEFSMAKLRDGDYSAEIAAAEARPGLAWPATIALTSLAWRNAWKYEDRSYRHWFWDAGVIAANLLAVASSEGLSAKVDVGFVDSDVDQLLGLKPGKEATVALVRLGPESSLKPRRQPGDMSQLDVRVEPLSKKEVDYPMIWSTNKASQLHSSGEVSAWRKSLKASKPVAGNPEPAFKLQGLKKAPLQTLDEVILRRGSTRRFAPQPISHEQLSTIIEASTSRVPLDFLSGGESLTDLYLIANQVQELSSGSYFFDREQNRLSQLKVGRFRDMSGYLCLGQPLFSDASAVFFLMTDLGRVLGSMGNRGYRAAQFEAGVRAGKVYLSSYSLGLGASGSTFFDDAVTEFFSPHARNKSAMIVVGVGVPGYKARPGRVLLYDQPR